MNCCRCEKRVKTPKPDYSVAELIELCRPRCVSCDPETMPRGGKSQVELSEFTASKRKPEPIVWGDADAGCRGVTPEAYDRYRTAMTSLFALNPLDLLIVQHIANGGSYGDFPNVYVELMAKCKRYHGSPRQMVRARRLKIESQMPQLKPMFDALIGKAKDRREVGE